MPEPHALDGQVVTWSAHAAAAQRGAGRTRPARRALSRCSPSRATPRMLSLGTASPSSSMAASATGPAATAAAGTVTTASRQLPGRCKSSTSSRALTCWANCYRAVQIVTVQSVTSGCVLPSNLSVSATEPTWTDSAWAGRRDWVGDRGLTGSPPREDSRRGVRDDRFGFMPLSFVPGEESPEDRATQLQVAPLIYGTASQRGCLASLIISQTGLGCGQWKKV